MTATVVSLINMKGGVGKTTLTFNLGWWAAWFGNLKVLVVDLDPQANLSQYCLGTEGYLNRLKSERGTVVDIFEQYSAPMRNSPGPSAVDSDRLIEKIGSWDDGSRLDLLPSRLELAWTLKNPTDKSHLLPQFLARISSAYDLILIDCAPTESILTTAAYLSSRYVVVPVRPEFLATIGLPLLARSMSEFRASRGDHAISISGIVFNDSDAARVRPEHNRSRRDVRDVSKSNGWPVFRNEVRHSNSFATGARDGTPIFNTSYAREYVANEFSAVAKEFLISVGVAT